MPDPALLLTDIQQGFKAPERGPRNTPGGEGYAARLLACWRAGAAPVIHVRHVSSTARMAANPGFGVTLADGACAAFPGNADTGWEAARPAMDAEAIHAAAISRLHGEFCRALPTQANLAGTR
ncbi:hypothetical protein [Sediminimonas sp.]|uniref:hypothetical protein n=1 Tax=Sediminimonas sp. TaxID=2823379 RepID=UPI0025E82FD6|nr:hypothetical protein [Sediminimonas sp.]